MPPKAVTSQHKGRVKGTLKAILKKKGKVLKMARERMITRTVTATVVTVMGVEVSTAKAFTEDVVLTGIFKDKADMLKAIKKSDSGDKVYAAVVSTRTEETLYGMSETEFMKYAKALPPRSKAD